jgi:4-aminobutyrate aminotransferase-like enzyme
MKTDRSHIPADLSEGDSNLSAGHVINWTPPLTISETELDRALAIFEAGLAEIESRAEL